MVISNPPYKAKVYRVIPKGFSSKLEIVACYICCDNNYLLLHRAEGESQKFTWSMPAGKIEKGEDPRQAVFREVNEETGIILDDDRLKDVGTLYIRYPHIDFIYHMFTQQYSQRPIVQLSIEHQDYCWIGVDEIFRLPLISGGKEAMHQFLALVETRI